MEWIDAHTHIGEDVGGETATAEELLAVMDEYGVDRAVVFCFDEVDGIPAGNDRVRRATADEDRLAGLFRVDPAVHEPGDLRGLDGFHGFKMHPRGQDFGMQQVYEHLEVIADTGKPVIIHTGVGDSQRRRAHPEEVLEAAATHPDVTIVMAHTLKGYYFHAPGEFRDRLQRQNNALLDISLMSTPSGIEVLVEDLGADRILFASDYPYGHPLPTQKKVELADIGRDERELVAGGNAARLFFDG
ncbi:MAG: amidohydrolase family protein [Candidatus Nanohaloarchaea archaeon]|nr:amidohydrolase family protein [Candidatus Nanohaloarchaea archaeon]